ncbi:para-aminobenzoate synthetase component 1 [Paraoerskovia marina]|uniref:Para-aminobenzoate synthetase component 1 n=1 Tax=Paraoerskovia marina TaxID=545619 RepID=A0A1H1SJ77_9CELL|nr:para-aminobenzoate synthetase component 1 [Paraoerskovia marina]
MECVDLHADPGALERGGLWFVVADFEGAERGGRARAWRFAESGPPPAPRAWRGPRPDRWRSSSDQQEYEAAVSTVRARVRSGDVYQVNVCRVLSAELSPEGSEPSAAALAHRLAQGNPAPYAGAIHVPAGSGVDPVWVVSASPELFLRLDQGIVTSGPIKGTATTAAGLSAKDRAENVMITDLVRNDLQRICEPGTVGVDRLLAVEQHPGLVHLVSTVSGALRPSASPWSDVLAATMPPASVSGAPKRAALGIVDELETEPRGPYCGAVGWVDADQGAAELAVGIRTFWWSDGVLRFGTGAGITWGSDPRAEWEETELKARRLVALASGAECDP